MSNMILKIDSSTALLIPDHLVAAAAELAAQAIPLKYVYRSEVDWERAETNVELVFLSKAPNIAHITEREQAIQKQLESKNSDWYKEYTARQAADKKASELEAQVKTLQETLARRPVVEVAGAAEVTVHGDVSLATTDTTGNTTIDLRDEPGF